MFGRLISARGLATSAARRGGHGVPPPGDNLPFAINNRYKFIRFGSGYLRVCGGGGGVKNVSSNRSTLKTTALIFEFSKLPVFLVYFSLSMTWQFITILF